MQSLLAALRHWLMTLLHVEEIRNALRRLAVQSAIGAVAGLLGLAALGFFLAALTVWLIHATGPIPALLIVGAILLLVAGIAILVMRGNNGAPARSEPSPPQTVATFSGPGRPGSLGATIAGAALEEIRAAGGITPLLTAIVGLGGGIYLRQQLRRRRRER